MKYKLITDKDGEPFYVKLRDHGWTEAYRIIAVKNFGDVKEGDIGGFVESENNLSQDGECWIYNDSVVAEDSIVIDDAKIYGKSCIYGTSRIMDNAKVYNSEISSNDCITIGTNIEVYDCELFSDGDLAIVCYDTSIQKLKNISICQN